MTNTEKEIKPKQYIRVINGIPYRVTLHCKKEGKTFKEKLERVIKIRFYIKKKKGISNNKVYFNHKLALSNH